MVRMDELKRVVRYTLPGVACITKLFIALLITDYWQVEEFLKNTAAVNSLGIILGIVLASGGLGYILSNIYWGLYWLPGLNQLIAINHTKLFYHLKDIIEIEGDSQLQNDLNNNRLSRKDAWTLGTIFLEERNFKLSDILKRVVDITHSLGAFIIGNFLALFAWIELHIWPSCKPFYADKYFIVIPIWLALIGLHSFNRFVAIRQQTELANAEIYRMITEEYSHKLRKVKIYFYR